MAALILFFVCIYFSIQLKQPKYIYTKDDWGYIQNTVVNKIAPNSLSIVALGGSTMREATDPKAVIYESIIRPTGLDYNFWNLSSSSQTLLESLAILSSIRPKRNSIVLINVSLIRFRPSRQDYIDEYQSPRMPFLDYSEVRKFFTSVNITTPKVSKIKQYMLWVQKLLEVIKNDHYKKYTSLTYKNWYPYCQEYLKQFFFTGVQGQYYRHKYQFMDPETRTSPMKAMSLDEKKRYLARIETDYYSSFFDNLDFNLKLLTYICNYASKKGYKVILIELPQDKLADNVDKKIVQAFKSAIKSITFKNVSIADYSNTLSFNSSDFFDLYHFMDSGRAKFSPIFSDLMKHTIKEV